MAAAGTDEGVARALRAVVELAFRGVRPAARSKLRHVLDATAPLLSVLARTVQARLRARPPRTAAQDIAVGETALDAIRHLIAGQDPTAASWIADHEQVLVSLARGLGAALQSNVVFVGRAPDLERPGDYAQYHFPKSELLQVLERWTHSVRWEPKLPIEPTPSANVFHRSRTYSRGVRRSEPAPMTRTSTG